MPQSRLAAIKHPTSLVHYCILAITGAAVLPMIFIGCAAAGFTHWLAIVIAALFLLKSWQFVVGRMEPRLIGRHVSRYVLFAVWVLLSALAAQRIAHLSVFMLDVVATDYALEPPSREMNDPDMAKPFFVKHNCFTCYIVAAELARQGVDNIYDPARYRNAEETTVIHETIGDALHIDRYQYPPPFLLLPRLLLATGGDFFQVRTYWFAINVLVFTATIATLVIWMTGYRFSVYWLAWPVVLLASTTLCALQIGNAHFLILCLSVLAMVCFETGRVRWGAVLLGFAIVSKIFPGLLLLYLLARRRWSAAAWTIGAMAALCLAALLTFGVAPFQTFVAYQLPRIAGGEAFSFAFEYVRPLTLNWSVCGIAPKLEKLGWLKDFDNARVMPVVTWLYSGFLVLVTVTVGLCHRARSPGPGRESEGTERRIRLARVWLVLLVLAQLRSPFLPWAYGGTAVLWLLVMLLPWGGSWLWKTVFLAMAWFVVSTPIPLWYGPPTVDFDLSYTLATLFGTLIVCLMTVITEVRGASGGRRKPRTGQLVAS